MGHGMAVGRALRLVFPWLWQAASAAGPAFDLRDGTFMKLLGLTPGNAVLTSQGQLVSRGMAGGAVSVQNLEAKLSYNIPAAKLDADLACSLGSGGLAILNNLGQLVVFDANAGPHTGRKLTGVSSCHNSGLQPMTHQLVQTVDGGLALRCAERISFWGVEAVHSGGHPLAWWSSPTPEQPLSIVGVCCGGLIVNVTGEFVLLLVQTAGQVSSKALRINSTTNSLQVLPKGGVATLHANTSTSAADCLLELSVFSTTALLQGGPASSKTRLSSEGGDCRGTLAAGPPDTLVLLLPKLQKVYIFLAASTDLDSVMELPVPDLTEGPNSFRSLLVLQEDILALATNKGVALLSLAAPHRPVGALVSAVADPDSVMIPWGRTGFGIIQTDAVAGSKLVLFNLSALTPRAAGEWQHAWPELSQGIGDLIPLAGGVAVYTGNYSGWRVLQFLNATENGDWTTTLLFKTTIASDFSPDGFWGLVRVSDLILAASYSGAKNTTVLLWNLTYASAYGDDEVLDPSCSMTVPNNYTSQVYLMGGTADGDLVLGLGLCVLLVPVAAMVECRFSYVELRKQQDGACSGPPLDPRYGFQSDAASCCDGGLAANMFEGNPYQIMSLFNASAVEAGGLPYAELEAWRVTKAEKTGQVWSSLLRHSGRVDFETGP